jgi:hypothetical protein
MLATPDRVEQAIDDFEQAARRADQRGDLALRWTSRAWLIWSRYQHADIAGVDTALAEMEDFTKAIGLPRQEYYLSQYVVGRRLLAGHADHAEAANELLLEAGTIAGEREVLAAYGGFLFAIRQHQGRLDEIVDFILDAARDNPWLSALRSTTISMLCDLGRMDEARPLLAAELASGLDYPFDSLWLAAMGNLTDAAASLTDPAAARALTDRLKRYANQVIVPEGKVVSGAFARPLARAATVLGEYDQAEAWFAVAHDLHVRLQAPHWIACGQLDHADLCLARRADGDLARTREFATTAAATAAEYGCAALSRRAANLLAAT